MLCSEMSGRKVKQMNQIKCGLFVLLPWLMLSTPRRWHHYPNSVPQGCQPDTLGRDQCSTCGWGGLPCGKRQEKPFANAGGWRTCGVTPGLWARQMPFGASFAAIRALAGLVQLLQACAPQAIKPLPEEPVDKRASSVYSAPLEQDKYSSICWRIFAFLWINSRKKAPHNPNLHPLFP